LAGAHITRRWIGAVTAYYDAAPPRGPQTCPVSLRLQARWHYVKGDGKMPAHIGFSGNMKIFFRAVQLAFDPRTQQHMRTRRVRGIDTSPIDIAKGQYDRAQHNKRERAALSYGAFRSYLDKFHGDNPEGNFHKWCEDTEWDLYLKPDTAFDQTVLAMFDDGGGMNVLFIFEKSDHTKLKRIEAAWSEVRGHRILWTAA
jgi:hypothetical protein